MQDGETALMYAAWMGRTAIVQYLVERTAAEVNATNNVSHSNSVNVFYCKCLCTLGILCCINNSVEIVRYSDIVSLASNNSQL